MAIQWFPGHMHLTRKAIEERIKDIDVVIEMLDARLPGSSANPMLAQLIQGKPGLKVLSKQDLADFNTHGLVVGALQRLAQRQSHWTRYQHGVPGQGLD
jgi:ribosome biogenesis GTPase A